GLSALVAGATLRRLPALGLLALLVRAALRLLRALAVLSGAALGRLAGGLLAAGVVSVVAAALGLLAPVVVGAGLVVLLVLVGVFAALAVARGGRGGYAHGQDCGECECTQEPSGEGEFHVGCISAAPTWRLARPLPLRMRDERALRTAGNVQCGAGVIVCSGRSPRIAVERGGVGFTSGTSRPAAERSLSISASSVRRIGKNPKRNLPCPA